MVDKGPSQSPDRILFAAGRELAYARNAQIVDALGKGYPVDPITCTASRLTTRLLKVGWRLLWHPIPPRSVVFLGFYGQPLVFPSRLRWSGPLILDAFVSTYDTYCFDRRVFRPHSIPGRMAFHLDRMSCRLADVVVVDTRAQARYFERTFGVSPSKIEVLYVGCDDQLFQPLQVPQPDPPVVLFYGSYLPLHGVDVILHAAEQMAGEPVRFVLIGRGQEYPQARALAERLHLTNLAFREPVALESLPEIIARATVCLGGHFGRSEKAGRVIAGKTFQCMAMEKPTIVGDNPANRELFTHREDVWMCAMADPEALAQAIRVLLDAPQLRARLGKQARKTVQRSCGNEMTARTVHSIVEIALAQHQRGAPRTRS